MFHHFSANMTQLFIVFFIWVILYFISKILFYTLKCIQVKLVSQTFSPSPNKTEELSESSQVQSKPQLFIELDTVSKTKMKLNKMYELSRTYLRLFMLNLFRVILINIVKMGVLWWSLWIWFVWVSLCYFLQIQSMLSYFFEYLGYSMFLSLKMLLEDLEHRCFQLDRCSICFSCWQCWIKGVGFKSRT